MKKIYIIKCVQTFVLCFAAAALYAQPGSIDSSFGENGFIYSSQAYNERGLLAQKTDKMIMRIFGTNSTGLRRYTQKGTFDSSFGNNSIINFDKNAPVDSVRSFALQSTDAIIILGSSSNHPGKTIVCRYTADGNLDNTFGVNGSSILSVPANTYLLTVKIDKDNVITLIGQAESDHTDQSAAVVMHLDSSGKTDTGFGNNGLTKIHFKSTIHINDIIARPDGKIIAVGGKTNHNDVGYIFDTVVVTAYNNDGSPDKNFNGTGLLMFVPPDSVNLYTGAWAQAVALQPDGKIIIAGSICDHQSHGRWTFGNYAVWRLNKNGAFDSTFGKKGAVFIDVLTYEIISGLAIDANGKIIISGTSGSTDLIYPSIAIARINADGNIDASFGNKGVLTLLEREDVYSFGIAFGTNRIYAEGKFLYSDSRHFVAAIKADTAVTGTGNDTTVIVKPFAFTAFHGSISDSTVQLTWQTSREKSLKPFTIERGKDSITFSAAGIVQASNTTGDHNYTFTDHLSSDTTVTYYYRIKSLDSSGITHYTEALKLTLIVAPPVVNPPIVDSPGSGTKVSVSPNPVTSQTRLMVTLMQSETLDLFVSNSSGRIMYKEHQRYPAGKSIITMPFDKLPHGMYYLKIKGGQVNLSKVFKR